MAEFNDLIVTGKTKAAQVVSTDIIDTGLISGRMVMTGPNLELTSSSVTSTEVAALSGVTSNIQTQINGLKTKTSTAVVSSLPTSTGTASESGKCTFTYVSGQNYSGGVFRYAYTLSLNPSVDTIIIGGTSGTSSTRDLVITSITPSTGSFTDGQILKIWAGSVHITSTLCGGWSAGYSEIGYAVSHPDGTSNCNSGAGFWKCDHPSWHEFVYYNGKWFGTNYVQVIADNKLRNSPLPPSGSAIQSYYGGDVATLDVKQTSQSTSLTDTTYADSTILPRVLHVTLSSTCSASIYLNNIPNQIMFISVYHVLNVSFHGTDGKNNSGQVINSYQFLSIPKSSSVVTSKYMIYSDATGHWQSDVFKFD